ncbi:hypothetical protein LUZ60_006037 [Juncus effusus]|nr:hypothetical protein LUZ60_006037 [Juncus effusus]
MEDYGFSSDDEEEEEMDCYLSDQEEDAIEETVLHVLEDGSAEDCRWSQSSVITQESLLAAQKEDLRKVTDLLSLTEHHARTLLMHHRWDVQRIFELLDRKGRNRLFAEAGITIKENKRVVSGSITCQICFDEVGVEESSEMDCGHRFCNDCWTSHFSVKITEGLSRRIKCMAPKCPTICSDSVIRQLISSSNPNLAAKFDRSLLESYVDDNDAVKWCPSAPHCGNAVKVKGDVMCEVACSCGEEFCFGCGGEAHSPCSCAMWEMWARKCRDESETVNWITVNTKPCPKCRKAVEKNGGCNLVACICGQAFCWLCGGATGRDHTWSSITGHSCGRFNEDQKLKSEYAKRNLYRYVHYHNRYKAHTDSLKQESVLKEKIKEKIAVSESKEGSEIKDYSWVGSGLGRLFRSRRVLSYSYPFAYYMFGDELFKDEMTPKERELRKNLFEDQQQQLEFNVERLSGFLEKDFQDLPDNEVKAIMEHVVTLSSVVDGLCRQMYQCIENELLYPLRSTHSISPYKSKGLEKAAELAIRPDSSELTCQNSNSAPGTIVTSALGKRAAHLHEASSSSSSSEENNCSSHKKAKLVQQVGPNSSDMAAPLFDLNVPLT